LKTILAGKELAFSFLPGGGEMGERIRNFDWNYTSVGSPEHWPQSLRTTLSIILNTRSPMFLWWGKDLIQFYNDAYRPSLGNNGKHPYALGQSGEDCWPEIWTIIKPLIDQVLAGGEATWSEDQLIPIYRNGKMEDVYWTFGYSAVIDENGKVGGVLVVCSETTAKVKNFQALQSKEETLQNIFSQAPVAIAIFRGPSFIIDFANEKVLEYWARSYEEVINKPLFEALPEAAGQGFEELLTHVMATGEKYIAKEHSINLNRNGKLEKTYINFLYEPYYNLHGTVRGVLVVANEITDTVSSRKALEENADQLERSVRERTTELRKANVELEKTNNQLKEFAYAASHDLQEPLRKITTFINMITEVEKGDLTDKSKIIFKKVISASERMNLLIGDLFVLSQISNYDHSIEEIDLNVVLERVTEELSMEIEQSGAIIHKDNFSAIRGITRQMQQLFQNLISNAIKYSKKEEAPVIYIKQGSVKTNDQPFDDLEPFTTYNKISFLDNGIGFSQEYSQKIFQMFYRLHGKSEYSGTGIGLAICKRIAENHKGIIKVESEEGIGSRFDVYLKY
jgi:PAS domain S-box-containing protein